jgi:hypothetical protein
VKVVAEPRDWEPDLERPRHPLWKSARSRAARTKRRHVWVWVTSPLSTAGWASSRVCFFCGAQRYRMLERKDGRLIIHQWMAKGDADWGGLEPPCTRRGR